MFRSGLDLNFVADICHPARQPFAGGVDEFGKTGVRADYGASAADDVSPLCGALRGRAQSQIVLVPRSIPVHGLCAAYLSGEPAGHRSVFACSRYQAVSPGYPRQRSAQHLGQRECGARLAYLCDLGPVADRNRPPAVCRRTLWGRLKETVYALDASTIDLCLSVFPWAPFRSAKAAVKLHTLLDLRGNIPTFLHISDGKLHDVNVLDLLLPEPGAFYVMDRGYIDFERLHRLHEAGSFFVTRAKSNLKAQRRYSHPVDRSTGLICDQTIALTGFYSRQDFDTPLRRIKFNDPETGKRLVFLSNNFALPAITITELYRCRWQVELFFKWIKQHLRIKVFFGTSENAVKTQIWIAVSVYVLVVIVKKRLNLSASLYEMLQILSLTLFERIPLEQLLHNIITDDIQRLA